MRAVLVESYAPAEKHKVRDAPDPTLSAGNAIIRVAAAGIGFVDSLKVQGLYQTKDPLPFIPGMEFAGTVEAIAEHTPGISVGDRVFGLAARGALAEKVAVSCTSLVKIPDHISDAQAAGVPLNYLTAAYGLIEVAAVQPGETLLVLGAAGGTGQAAIKLAKMLGAHVIAGASTEAKRSFARAEGADSVIDYTQDNWREALKTLLGKKAVDVVFDPIGGDISPIAFRTLAWRGRHLVVGFAAGKIPSLAFNIALLKGASLMGVDSAQIQKWEPETYVRLFRRIADGLQSRSLEPPAVQRFAFDSFLEGFQAMTSRQTLGKVVMTMT